MQPLSVNDFVETPDGRGTVVNFVYLQDKEITDLIGDVTAVLVHLDGTENSDRNWRMFELEEVKKV